MQVATTGEMEGQGPSEGWRNADEQQPMRGVDVYWISLILSYLRHETIGEDSIPLGNKLGP